MPQTGFLDDAVDKPAMQSCGERLANHVLVCDVASKPREHLSENEVGSVTYIHDISIGRIVIIIKRGILKRYAASNGTVRLNKKTVHATQDICIFQNR